MALADKGERRLEPPETIYVDERIVGCDGGGGALGHPSVYLNLEASGTVDCPYCGRRYIIRSAPDGGGNE